MAMSSHDHMKGYFTHFFEALTNVFIFLPYFFSVSTLSKTLFYPWKNITDTEKKPGFSFSRYASSILFGLISRGIGFWMRISIILFYFLITALYILIIPILFFVFILSLPAAYIIFTIKEPESERKARLKDAFIKNHLLSEEHFQDVERWFEYVYDLELRPHHWWKLSQLLSIPPLARDWTHGFTPLLDQYAEDLTDPSYQLGIRHHIIGREQETALIERALSKSDEANVLLVGEEGVGKMAIVNSVAKKIYEGKTNSLLSYKRLLKLDMEKILSKHSDPQKREEFLDQLLSEASQAKNIIIFVESLERYVSEGDSHVNLSAPFTKYASTPHLQLLGVTTPFLYETFIFPNSSLRTIMTKIDVSEVSKDKALLILLDKAVYFERRHHLHIPYEVLTTIIEKSAFYVTSIPFPEKALQLLDSVCVYTVQTLKARQVPLSAVDTVLSQTTHVKTTLDQKIKDTLVHLEGLLQQKILGQTESIRMVSATLRRAFLLMGKRKKPLASFLFLGPTGVGKTETAKVLAEVLFGSRTIVSRFDMSSYQSKDDISLLVGSVEKLNPGLLTLAVREHPYGVLLLDEIEKAHPDLLNIFLTMLDEGYYSDGYGQRVDCKNLVIVATSNAGADHIHHILTRQSDNTQSDSSALASNNLINYLIEQRLFTPEFLNRFDGVVAYKPLGEDTAYSIAKSLIESTKNNIYALYKVHVNVSDETIRAIIQKGYDVSYGARNLERVMRESIEDKISKIILEGKAKEGDTIKV